jgi:hypothetical protein
MSTPLSDKQDGGKTKRVFLRIPIKLPARIILTGRPDKEVYIDELSTTGLSFYLEKSEEVPDFFDLDFRLTQFSKVIKIKLEVKSRSSIPGGLRVGCRFAEVLDEDKKLIINYICKFADPSFPLRVVSIAAFFCSLDSSWRVAAYLLYYEGIKFENEFRIALTDHFYFIVLLLYLVCSFVAFIFSGQVTHKKGKALFLTSILCLIPALIFITAKNITYWKFWILHSEKIFVNVFFWIYVLFGFYTALSIIVGIASFKKINLVLDILGQHTAPVGK